MNDKKSRFRDQLLEADEPRSDREATYRKELHAMLVKELSLPRKVIFAVVAIASTVTGGLCAFLAATEPNLPWAARAALTVGALFAVAWLVTIVGVLRRGKLDVKTDERRIAQMVWTFTVVSMVFFLYLGMSATDQFMGVKAILYGLTFLIAAAVYWITHMIQRAQLSTREKLLELELHLAELAEKH